MKTPAHLAAIAEKVAHLRGEPTEAVAEITFGNAVRLFDREAIARSAYPGEELIQSRPRIKYKKIKQKEEYPRGDCRKPRLADGAVSEKGPQSRRLSARRR